MSRGRGGPEPRRSGGVLELPAGCAGDLLVNDLPSGIFAAAAAATDRQTALHVEERRRPALDLFANIAIGDGMADADVHGKSSRNGTQAGERILIANKNDCQLQGLRLEPFPCRSAGRSAGRLNPSTERVRAIGKP